MEYIEESVYPNGNNEPELWLISRKLGDIEIIKIVKELENNTTILHVKFNNNDINDKGAIAIAEMLKINTTLKSLGLYGNNITCIGAVAISNVLKTNTTLIQLDLEANNIDGRGYNAISNMLKINTTLEELILSYNYINVEGMKSLCGAIYLNNSLIYFELSFITDKFKKYIKNIMKRNMHNKQIKNITLQKLCWNILNKKGNEEQLDKLKIIYINHYNRLYIKN